MARTHYVDGDIYIQRNNQDFWMRKGGVWVRMGNIRDEGAGGIIGIAPVTSFGFAMRADIIRRRLLESSNSQFGFGVAAEVQRKRAAVALQALGFGVDVAIERRRQIAAEFQMGFTMEPVPLVDLIIYVAASLGFGFTVEAPVDDEYPDFDVEADFDMGMSMDVAIDMVVRIAAEMQMGFDKSVTVDTEEPEPSDTGQATCEVYGSNSPNGSMVAVYLYDNDPDGSGVTPIQYEWYSNDTLIPGENAEFYITQPADGGYFMKARVQYTDALGNVAWTPLSAGFGPIAYADTGDATADLSWDPGGLEPGRKIYCTFNDDDPDGPADEDYCNIQFQQETSPGTWAALGSNNVGVFNAEYTLTTTQLTRKVRARVTYVDPTGTSETIYTDEYGPVSYVSSGSGTITLSGTARQGNVLTATYENNDPDGEPATSASYQWEKATTSGGTYSNISGATANTRTLVLADVGFYLRCKMTYTDAEGHTNTIWTNPTAAAVLSATAASWNVTVKYTGAYTGTGSSFAASSVTWAPGSLAVVIVTFSRQSSGAGNVSSVTGIPDGNAIAQQTVGHVSTAPSLATNDRGYRNEVYCRLNTTGGTGTVTVNFAAAQPSGQACTVTILEVTGMQRAMSNPAGSDVVTAGVYNGTSDSASQVNAPGVYCDIPEPDCMTIVVANSHPAVNASSPLFGGSSSGVTTIYDNNGTHFNTLVASKVLNADENFTASGSTYSGLTTYFTIKGAPL